ncbi:hypothetical protein PMZ80_001120 [Knufia obscura]|uniref:Trafficking protein particle complex II-specific subunit 65 IgD3 domain-containing protein n=1 Tax=Knufia obscura TaxID=1635080 RepID=A0ABR0S3R1_9EURO|nr:hypothetical protein PMZ80_001120 [Knufia obscura]
MTFAQDDREFLQSVTAGVIVPADSTASLDEILDGQSDIRSRSTLYFDERLKVLISLDIPSCPEEKLHSYLGRLELRVDAWAISAQNGEERSPVDGVPKRDLIASESISNTEDPFVLVKQDGDRDEVRLQLIWEVYLTLGRPRLRSYDQSVVFVPIATVLEHDGSADDVEYLEPFQVLEPNVLEPLSGLAGTDDRPYLPMSRLERVVPTQPKKDRSIRIRHQTTDPIQAYTAVMPRLKYNKIDTSMPNPTTIASVDLEVIPFLQLEGSIETVDLSMANGKVTPLMPDFLPTSCKSKDCITFLYRLQPSQHTDSNSSAEPTTTPPPSPTSNLNVDILAISVLVKLNISSTTTATISMSWTTNVDFSTALNPAFGAPAQPMQRISRPTSLNFTPYPDPSKARDRANSVRTASTSLQHQMIPQSASRQPLTSILSISFIAPDEPVHIGLSFTWRVLILNNSLKPAKLAIVPLPRIQRPTNATQHFQKRHAPKASNASLQPVSTGAKKHTRNHPSTAKAVVEEQVLYALHHQASSSAVPAETDLVSLTAELRIGPLAVGACHEAEITFIAYKAGVFAVDAIRVVDLAGEGEGGVGRINDIRELPEVVVVDAEGDAASDE